MLSNENIHKTFEFIIYELICTSVDISKLYTLKLRKCLKINSFNLSFTGSNLSLKTDVFKNDVVTDLCVLIFSDFKTYIENGKQYLRHVINNFYFSCNERNA